MWKIASHYLAYNNTWGDVIEDIWNQWKKYKVERVSADSKTQLIDRLVYLLIDLRNENLNSSNQGEDDG